MLGSGSKACVRKGRVGDAPALSDIFRESWQLAYRGIIPHVQLEGYIRQRTPAWWRGAVRTGDGTLVLDLDGNAVGINIARAGRVNSYALPTSVVLAVLEDLKSGQLAPKEPSPDIERLAELDRNIQMTTKALNEQNARRADAAKTLGEAEKSVADLEQSLQAARAARDVAKQKADAAQTAIDELKSKLDKLQAQRDELESP